MIFRNRILSSMDEASLAALLPHLRTAPLVRDQVLAEQDAPVPQVWFPETAILSSLRLMRDGSAVELATIGHEGAAGLLACLSGSGSHSRITAQVAGSALAAPTYRLRALASTSPRLHLALLEGIRVVADQVEQNLACGALHDAAPRLARWLLETRDRSATDRLPLTQEELATMLGVQRSTVNAAALRMKTMGAIRYSRGVVQVVDAARLEAVACECYRAAVADATDDPVLERRIA